MPPSKFSSFRNSRRRPAYLIPFRDDLGLVGLRYEKTIQAEPPIPIPAPKNLRPARSASTISTSSRTMSSFSTGPNSPPLSPPAEEHPALRSEFSSEESRDDWKRDSGVAQTTSTASTTSTIYEEDFDVTRLYGKELELAAEHAAMVRGITEHVELADEPAVADRRGSHATLPADSPEDSSSTPQHPVPLPLPSPTILSRQPSQPASETSTASSVVAASPESPSRRKTRGFSFRMGSAHRLRKKSIVEMEPSDSSTPFPFVGAAPRSSRSGSVSSSTSRGQGGGLSSSLGSLGPSLPNLAPARDGANKRTHGPPPPLSHCDQRPVTNHDCRAPDSDFSPIAVAIPTDSLLGDDFLTSVSFSKRGSLMFGGKRAFPYENMPESTTQPAAEVSDVVVPRAFPLVPPSKKRTSPDNCEDLAKPTTPEAAHKEAVDDVATVATAPSAATADNDATDVLPAQPRQPIPNIRVLAADVERDSHKVRSLYEAGDAVNWEHGAPVPSLAADRLTAAPEDPVGKDKHDTSGKSPDKAPASEQTISASVDSSPPLPDLVRREYELAGGVEDWEDVDGADVDRYGFIRPPRNLDTVPERTGRPTSRRRNLLGRRDPSELNSARAPNKKLSARSLHTQASELSAASMRSSASTLRQAANLLPHNRNRRRADEAGEMLTHVPGIQHISEDEKAEKISESVKRKEWERAEKWRKMAKVVRKGKDGEGMEFEFDTKHPKLIDRTWKGIPDRWRGAAWYSFLATSAKARKDAPTEEHLFAEFRRLQSVSCEDDVQIDMDVPRTINQHIMFRRRYRGGQRLLFRVLHAVALYYDEIGYVQGMASLAATLLCYFDEEKAFVMIVRMWQLRGLEQLYRYGFEGLMACLRDLEDRWLAGKEVANKLKELDIDATAFGTKWYLTLFNLSIPFPAQLRVWDVFLLLGDSPATSPKSDSAPAGMDVLHAASTAIIDALTDIILDSDFENTMKVLTSWIPIKDEDLLMKVARSELKYTWRKKG